VIKGMIPAVSPSFLKEKIPSARLVTISGAGHMVMLEKQRVVNQAIQEFIFQNS
jgi:pimeloyl-ACP methyl ester carboxylesterase